MAKAEMTIRAVAELDPSVMQLLTEIRDRLPEPTANPVVLAPVITGIPWHDEKPARPVQEPAPAALGEQVALGHRQALAVLLVVLDDWIEGAHSNHEGGGHRGENIGSECWRQFTPQDIRAMVNDAAREVGIPEFPIQINTREDSY